MQVKVYYYPMIFPWMEFKRAEFGQKVPGEKCVRVHESTYIDRAGEIDYSLP